MIFQHFSFVFEFTAAEPLAVYDFPDLCDELAGPFGLRSFASYMCEIILLCTCKGFRNEV